MVKKSLLKGLAIVHGVLMLVLAVIAVIPIISNEIDFGLAIVIAVIVFNGMFIIAASFYLGRKSLNFERSLKIKTESYKRETEHLKASNNQQSNFTEKMLSIHRGMLRRLNTAASKLYEGKRILNDNVKRVNEKSNLCQEEKKGMCDVYKNDFINSMLSGCNGFLRETTSDLKNLLDSRLKVKGIDLEVSIAIKTFDRIVESNGDTNGVEIRTIYRDRQSFQDGREIRRVPYTIAGNTAFQECLQDKHYFKNDISQEDMISGEYSNENPACPNNYNCVAVAPIAFIVDAEPHKPHRFYGYIACDVMNLDPSVKVFDKQSADVIYVAANIVGIYLDELRYQWEHLIISNEVELLKAIHASEERI